MQNSKSCSLARTLNLYAVTDRTWLNGRSLAECVELSLKGGATFVQLREKNFSATEFETEGWQLKALCKKYGVPFVINDDVELAKKIDADGVHIGQSDMLLQEARKILGPDKIIGVSAQTVQEALLAEKNGADYLGVGAVFPTGTKLDAVDVPLETLKDICQAVKIPVVAIGGISEKNISALYKSGIVGVAVVSAIFAASDIQKASRNLAELCKPFGRDGGFGLGSSGRDTTTPVAGTDESSRRSCTKQNGAGVVAFDKIDELLRFKHAVFDLDGTLIDSMPVWHDSAKTFLQKVGIQAEPNLNAVLFNLSLKNGAKYIQQKYLPHYSVEQILQGIKDVVVDAYKNTIPLKNGAKDFLDKLKKHGINCAIATSNDKELVQIVLARLGVADFFQEIFTCGELETSKDEATIYEKAMQALGGTKDDTIIFEDACVPVLTAKKAEFTVAAIQDEASASDWARIQQAADFAFTNWA